MNLYSFKLQVRKVFFLTEEPEMPWTALYLMAGLFISWMDQHGCLSAAPASTTELLDTQPHWAVQNVNRWLDLKSKFNRCLVSLIK